MYGGSLLWHFKLRSLRLPVQFLRSNAYKDCGAFGMVCQSGISAAVLQAWLAVPATPHCRCLLGLGLGCRV